MRGQRESNDTSVVLLIIIEKPRHVEISRSVTSVKSLFFIYHKSANFPKNLFDKFDTVALNPL